MKVSASQVLDRVQSLAHIATFEAEPHAYAEQLAAELGEATTREALATRDDRLRDALSRIDAMASRVMRIRLDHALADDAAIAPPTRRVFAATVADYAGRLELLEARARDVAGRGGSHDPATSAARVVDAATATLGLRTATRRAVLDLIARLAAATMAAADQHARDRQEAEPARRAWSAIRRELESVAARPERVAEGPFTARLAAWPEQLDEPDPGIEPTFADMIELD